METGNLHVSKKAKIDTMEEYTIDNGIDIESVQLKDGLVTNYLRDDETLVAGAGAGEQQWVLDEDGFASNSDTHVATQQSIKAYVDAVASGLDLKASCTVATTTTLPAYGGTGTGILTMNVAAILTIDGVNTVLGDRILVKDEGALGVADVDNGIYEVTTEGTGGVAAVLTRTSDADTSVEVNAGMFTFITEGTYNEGRGFVLVTDDPITINVTPLLFSQFSGLDTITAGAGLTKTNDTLDVGAGTGIQVNADSVEHIAHTGDVAGATALTIQPLAVENGMLEDDVVTYDKMQNVVLNNRILGNNTADDSIIQELTPAEVSTILGLIPEDTARKANSFTMGSALFDRISDPALIVLQTDTPTNATTCNDYSSAAQIGLFKNTDADEKVEKGTVYALNLNGTDEYIEFNDADSFTFSEMTVGSTVEVALGAADRTIISKWDETGAAELREWKFYIDDEEKLNLDLYDESANVVATTVSNAALAVGYHHVVATYNGKTGGSFSVILYVDGVVVASTTVSAEFLGMENLDTPVRIGCLENAAGAMADFWSGELGVVYLDGVDWAASDIWSMWLEFKGRYNI